MPTYNPNPLPEPDRKRNGWPWRWKPDLGWQGQRQDWPKISIITPSFNQATYLEETLRSVLLQGYPNLEYLVIDGGSRNGSVDILKRYQPHLTYWASERDHGQAHAIDKGFARATGDILAWLNSDDTYQPGVLQSVANYFRSHPETDIVSGRCRLWYGRDDDPFIGPSPLRTYEDFLKVGSNWMNQHLILQPEAFFRRPAYSKAGGLRQDLHYCLDVALWMDMARAGCRFDSTCEHWANLRMHADQKTAELNLAYAELAGVAWQYLQRDWELHGSRTHEIASDIFNALNKIRAEDRRQFEILRNSTSYRIGRIATCLKFW